MPFPKQFRSVFSTYERKEQIGQGGSGRVFAATDDEGILVAIKILDPSLATHARLRRFQNEIAFCSQSNHENVVRVIDYGLVSQGEADIPFFVMPMYDESLRHLMRESLLPADVLPIFEKILRGVEAAHNKSVVHRDLKPENILIGRRRLNGLEVVVADFGIAEFTDEELFTAVETRASERLANFQYAAPEQRARGRTVDIRADIYSLGLMLNELVTGEVPIGSHFKTIAAVSKELGYLDAVIETMIRQDPIERFNSIEEVRREIRVRQDIAESDERVRRAREIEVADSDLQDPILADPIRIIDVGWSDGQLNLTFQRETNNHWDWALRNMGGYHAAMGAEPERWVLSGNTASVSIRAESAQSAIEYFKQWLPHIHSAYQRRLRSIAEQSEDRKRKELKERLAREELNSRMSRELHL